MIGLLSPQIADLVGVAAWSGGVVEVIGPVVVRSAEAFTQRASSAAVVDYELVADSPDHDLDALVRRVERWYGSRQELALWQVSDHDQTIASALARAGYVPGQPTAVFVRKAQSLIAGVSAANRACTLDKCSDGWFETWHSVSGRHVGPSISRRFMEKIEHGQWISASASSDSKNGPELGSVGSDSAGLGSVGLGIDVGPTFHPKGAPKEGLRLPRARVVCCMATRPKARRRGLASDVLALLLDTERACVLQVVETNPARYLYEAHGFTMSHSYRYYRQGQG